MILAAILFFSAKTTNFAPRERASKPNAPEPAKASKKVTSFHEERREVRAEKAASLALSEEGRVISGGGEERCLPLNLPLMMRILFAPFSVLRKVKVLSQKVFYRFGGDFRYFTFAKVAKLESAVTDADKAGDGKSEELHHLADFAVLALGYRDRCPSVGALFLFNRQFGRAVFYAANVYAFFKATDDFRRDFAMNADAVFPFPAGRGAFRLGQKP